MKSVTIHNCSDCPFIDIDTSFYDEGDGYICNDTDYYCRFTENDVLSNRNNETFNEDCPIRDGVIVEVEKG